MLLLESRRFAVGEIAMMVGYRTFAAFSHAFRERFGVRPSDVRPSAQPRVRGTMARQLD